LVILSMILVVVDFEKIFLTTSYAFDMVSRNLSAGVIEGSFLDLEAVEFD